MQRLLKVGVSNRSLCISFIYYSPSLIWLNSCTPTSETRHVILYLAMNLYWSCYWKAFFKLSWASPQRLGLDRKKLVNISVNDYLFVAQVCWKPFCKRTDNLLLRHTSTHSFQMTTSPETGMCNIMMVFIYLYKSRICSSRRPLNQNTFHVCAESYFILSHHPCSPDLNHTYENNWSKKQI